MILNFKRALSLSRARTNAHRIEGMSHSNSNSNKHWKCWLHQHLRTMEKETLPKLYIHNPSFISRFYELVTTTSTTNTLMHRVPRWNFHWDNNNNIETMSSLCCVFFSPSSSFIWRFVVRMQCQQSNGIDAVGRKCYVKRQYTFYYGTNASTMKAPPAIEHFSLLT